MKHTNSRGKTKFYDEFTLTAGSEAVMHYKQTDKHTPLNTISCLKHKEMYESDNGLVKGLSYRYLLMKRNLEFALIINTTTIGDIDVRLVTGLITPYSFLKDFYNSMKKYEYTENVDAYIGSLSVAVGAIQEDFREENMRINNEIFIETPYDTMNANRIVASTDNPVTDLTGVLGVSAGYDIYADADCSFLTGDDVTGDVLVLPVYGECIEGGDFKDYEELAEIGLEKPNCAALSITTVSAWETLLNHNGWIKDYYAQLF